MQLHRTKKSTKHNKSQYTLFYFLMMVLIQVSTVKASNELNVIDLSALGSFDANFAEVKKINFIKAQSLIGEVDHMPGENYSVTLPFDVQQISYLVKNGNLVNKGDKIAIVEGYDVHHFIDEYESAKTLLGIQENHFQTNKKYFENKTIKSSKWIEITKNYFEAKLNFEHVQHLMSFLSIDENEEISLITLKAGILQIPNLMEGKSAGDLAFDVINKDAIKVKVTSPLLLASNISGFELNSTCSLNVDYIENIASKFHQTLWTSPASPDCELTLGQVVKVTPIQNIDGYKIAKSAVFEFEDKDYIAVKNKETLSLLPINLISTSKGEYIFTTPENINKKLVLTSSVSIVKGNLLGLGAE